MSGYTPVSWTTVARTELAKPKCELNGSDIWVHPLRFARMTVADSVPGYIKRSLHDGRETSGQQPRRHSRLFESFAPILHLRVAGNNGMLCGMWHVAPDNHDHSCWISLVQRVCCLSSCACTTIGSSGDRRWLANNVPSLQSATRADCFGQTV